MKKIFILIVLAVNIFTAKCNPTTDAEENVNLNNLYWDAVKLYKSEDYALALRYFSFLNDQDADNYDYNYYTGMCYFHLNKPKLAKFYFNQLADNSVYTLKVKILSRLEDNLGVENLEGY